jgi:hypothetical protein
MPRNELRHRRVCRAHTLQTSSRPTPRRADVLVINGGGNPDDASNIRRDQPDLAIAPDPGVVTASSMAEP